MEEHVPRFQVLPRRGPKKATGQIIRVDMETLEYVQTMSYCRPTCVYL